jgi:CelD/BcsL family acetyltransferase involved in cellulose biosynthesis
VLSTTIATTASEMERFRPVWDKLCAMQSPTATIFQSFSWNHLAAKIFASRESPHVMLIENDNGAVLIPAAIRQTEISLLGETLFDYRDILHAGDSSLIKHAWEALSTLRRPFRLVGLRADAAARWGALAVQPFCRAPQVLAREISAEAFESEHRRSARLLRRLEDLGVELKTYPGTHSALVSTVYCRKAKQFAVGETNLFRDPLRTQFMLHACALQAFSAPRHFPKMEGALHAEFPKVEGVPHLLSLGRCGLEAMHAQASVESGTWNVERETENPERMPCELFTLETSAALVAALVTFLDRRTRRFYTVYYDPAWAKSSPGHALVYEVARRSLSAGLDCDLMTGEHPYKSRLATSAVPLYRVEADSDTLARASREEISRAA